MESKGIDLNYFNGDAEAFRQRFGIADPGEPPPTGGEGNKYRVELNIREEPGTDENVIGVLQQDEVLEVLDTTVDESWMQVKRADGTTGWIYNTHLIKVKIPNHPEMATEMATRPLL